MEFVEGSLRLEGGLLDLMVVLNRLSGCPMKELVKREERERKRKEREEKEKEEREEKGEGEGEGEGDEGVKNRDKDKDNENDNENKNDKEETKDNNNNNNKPETLDSPSFFSFFKSRPSLDSPRSRPSRSPLSLSKSRPSLDSPPSRPSLSSSLTRSRSLFSFSLSPPPLSVDYFDCYLPHVVKRRGREGGGFVYPPFIDVCFDVIMKYGLSTEGIFRVKCISQKVCCWWWCWWFCHYAFLLLLYFNYYHTILINLTHPPLSLLLPRPSKMPNYSVTITSLSLSPPLPPKKIYIFVLDC